MAKKKNNLRRSIILAMAIMLLMLLISLYVIYRNTKSSMYEAFGIEIPGRYAIHGIDVSHHQHYVDWNAVKEMNSGGKKIGFVFVKATEGVSRTDRLFRRNWNAVGRVRLPRGAYHFFLANRDPGQQARNFINVVKLEAGDLPPVLDVEEGMGLSSVEIKERVIQWLKIIENYYGVRPILYTNIDFYKKHLDGALDRYPLWIAHYLHPDKPRIRRDWVFWQHSERGRVSGIRTRVDFNVFSGDSSEFSRLLIPDRH
jgi:lysozyme